MNLRLGRPRPELVERLFPLTTGNAPCSISLGVDWRLFCVIWRNYWVPLPVLNITGDCSGIPSSSLPGGGNGGGWISGGQAGSSGQPYSYIPSLSSPTNCDPCDPDTFTPDRFCVGIEASIGGALGAVVGALESVVPYISDVEASVNAEGCLETCCFEGGIGLSLSASGGASIGAEIDLAEVEFSLPSSVMTPIPGHSVDVTLELGCDIPISFAVDYAVMRTCEGETEVEVCMSGSLTPGCGVEVEVEVDGLGIDVDALSLQVRLGVSASICYKDGEWTGEVCFDGLWVEGSLSIPVEGVIQPVFSGQHYFLNESCFPSESASSHAASAGFIDFSNVAPPVLPSTLVRYKRTPIQPQTSLPIGATPFGGAPQPASCAQVRLQLQQEVAITRSAFSATLEVNNESDSAPVENFLASVQVYDQNGNTVNHLFGIDDPSLFTLDAVDGTGTLAQSSVGTARWLIVPTRDAAPVVDTTYFVGGIFSYTLAGTNYAVALESVEITVRPDASLALHYFWQRDVVGDDPFTLPVEASEAFVIGLLIENLGFGTAYNVRVASNQPEIVENENGLLIGFDLIGTQVGEEEVSPSLTANFGDIPPMSTAVAQFLLLSSLQGQFLADYSVVIDHVDDFGNPRTSLIDSVVVHELIRSVLSDTPMDNIPDFLTNEIPWPADTNEVDPTDTATYDPDRIDVPDTLRHSDGSVSMVTAHLNATLTELGSTITPVLSGATVGADLVFGSTQAADIRRSTHVLQEVEYELTIPGPLTSWNYIKVPIQLDNQYELVSVKRADNSEVQVGANAWITDRVFQEDDPPLNEYRLHILDQHGDGVYRIKFAR